MFICKGDGYFFHHTKIRTFHASLVSLFVILIDAMTKNIKVLRTCGGSVAMATIYLVMFGILFMNTHNVANIHECTSMQSFVTIRCRLETFQGVSTNFGDNPRIFLFKLKTEFCIKN